MPRQKKAWKGGGRPCGAYSELSSEEKKEYHGRKAAQAYTTAAESTSASHEEPRHVGRPPITDSAMTPNTLKHHKRQLTTDKGRESVRKVKQKAASKRWQFEYMDSKAPDKSESESSSGQVEVHTKELEASRPTLAPSSRTIFHLKTRLIGLLTSNPIDNLDLFIVSIVSLLLLYWTQKTMSKLLWCTVYAPKAL